MKLGRRFNVLYLSCGFVVGLLVGVNLNAFLTTCPDPYHKDSDYAFSNDSVTLNEERPGIKNAAHRHVRVLCWILTYPKNHNKSKSVKETWGKRCNKLLFISSEAGTLRSDDALGAIKLDGVVEGRHYVWTKTKEAFKYIHAHHLEDADWFVKADDDSYLILENLWALLYSYSPNNPIYFGCRFKAGMFRYGNPDGYMTGGAGYVLSKAAVQKFVDEALKDGRKCHLGDTDGGEDVHLARCLHNVGVKPGESRDNLDRFRFFPLNPKLLAAPMDMAIIDHSYYWRRNWYNTSRKEGMTAMSDRPISFHYVSPQEMYVLEYLLYKVKPIAKTQ